MYSKKYLEYGIGLLEHIVNIPSPSGFTGELMKYLKQEAEQMGYSASICYNGNLVVDVPGRTEGETLCVTAHADALGAMVRSINDDGTLNFKSVGGYTMQSIEGEYCKIHSRRTGRVYDGTVLAKSPSVHVYDDARTLERSEANMEIRMDAYVTSKADVIAIGVNNGDYVSFDPRFVHTDSGYIKSRHLDDKASVADIYALLKYMKDEEKLPIVPLKVMITGREEIGQGGSWVPEGVHRMLVVDMGCVGADLAGSEYATSICAMDSSGPYNYDMTNELIQLAEAHAIDYVVDVFPHYGSDGSVAMKSGTDIACALIGQGIHASHGMERTHEKGMEATLKLLMLYLDV